MPKTDLARAQVGTLRQKLIKIGAVVKESDFTRAFPARAFIGRGASCCPSPQAIPGSKLWHEAAHSVGALVT